MEHRMSDWNNRFTDLIRQSRPNLWGNWALASQVQPGAVGFVDPSTGAFKLVAPSLPGVSIQEDHTASTWKLSSEGVSRHQGDAKGQASIVDPNTGLRVSPEVEFIWKFEKKDSLASEFAIAKEATVSNLGALSDQYEWLLSEAKKVGFAQGEKIAQGFGVITQVIYAQSGVNIGANDRDSSYTLGGSADALHALLGEAGPKASVKASYGYSRATRSVDKHIWPATEGQAAQSPIPLAYSFSSFEGTTVLPAWRGRVDRLAIHLDSKASKATTYTTRAMLHYTLHGVRKAEPVVVISGGLSGSFANIPLDATQVTLELTFLGLVKNVKQTFNWDLPLAQWPLGNMHIDITGTWPGKPEAIIRNDLNNRR
jgi:hypothetical protein